ncbi:MAG: polysaccharide pyruvyl transferase family protein [Paraglaciecola sp.]|nr:polysaccharide pyruvyl transferase family protein [Paraglaciecola sp.]
MNVTFSGFYGMENTGDDCFCKVAEWGAQKYWNVDTSYFLSKKIPVLSKNSKPVLKKLHHRLSFINEFLMNRHFTKNNQLIYAGGSIFHGKEWWEMEYARNNIDKFDLKIGAIGVSVGPFDSLSHEKKVIEFMKKMTFICVRDQKSYDLVKSYDLDLPCIDGFDLAGLLPRMSNTSITYKASTGAVTIGLALCLYSGRSGQTHHENQSRLQLLATAINKLNTSWDKDLTLKLFVFNGHETYGDLEATRMFANLLEAKVKYEIHDYNRDPMSMWCQISACDAMLSFRLHGAIYAFMAKVPFLLAEVHEKSTNFLDDINWSQNFRVGDFELSSENLAKMIELLVAKDDFSHDVERCIVKAEKNFTEAIF